MIIKINEVFGSSSKIDDLCIKDVKKRLIIDDIEYNLYPWLSYTSGSVIVYTEQLTELYYNRKFSGL